MNTDKTSDLDPLSVLSEEHLAINKLIFQHDSDHKQTANKVKGHLERKSLMLSVYLQ